MGARADYAGHARLQACGCLPDTAMRVGSRERPGHGSAWEGIPKGGSAEAEDATDTSETVRVLTLMHASEY